MMTMTYHEAYGDVSTAQLRAYKAHNVSTTDHETLELYYGSDHLAITKAVLACILPGSRSFSVYHFLTQYV